MHSTRYLLIIALVKVSRSHHALHLCCPAEHPQQTASTSAYQASSPCTYASALSAYLQMVELHQPAQQRHTSCQKHSHLQDNLPFIELVSHLCHAQHLSEDIKVVTSAELFGQLVLAIHLCNGGCLTKPGFSCCMRERRTATSLVVMLLLCHKTAELPKQELPHGSGLSDRVCAFARAGAQLSSLATTTMRIPCPLLWLSPNAGRCECLLDRVRMPQQACS